MIGGVWRFSQIEQLVENFPDIKNGLMVDTNVIFAGSYELDHFNSEVSKFIADLNNLNIPLFTNVNVRTEFLDLHRRVLIAECLIDMYEVAADDLAPSLSHQLKSLRTRYRKAVDEGRLFKLSDKEIKNFRSLLVQANFGEKDGWDFFCQVYLFDKMTCVWDLAVKEYNLSPLSLREGERSPQIIGDISWYEMVKLVGRYGVGVADAMILNMFLNSSFKVLASADTDAVYCLNKMQESGKLVIVPDSLQLDLLLA